MNTTFTIFLVLITIVSLFLIAVIMVQNSKGGGLDSSLGGGTNVGGVQNTNKFLENTTWTLAIALLGLILFSSLSLDGGGVDSKIMDADAAVSAPVTPSDKADETKKNEAKQEESNSEETSAE